MYKKVYSHKIIRANLGFAALCSEVVFFTYSENLLGHFSKMDKESTCPKFKNEPKSFSGVFMWELYNCGIIMLKCLL